MVSFMPALPTRNESLPSPLPFLCHVPSQIEKAKYHPDDRSEEEHFMAAQNILIVILYPGIHP